MRFGREHMTKTLSHVGLPFNLNAGKKKKKDRAANENTRGIQTRIELRIGTEKMTKTSIHGGERERNRGRRPVQGMMLTVPAAMQNKRR
jgi:hypothetical protein